MDAADLSRLKPTLDESQAWLNPVQKADGWVIEPTADRFVWNAKREADGLTLQPRDRPLSRPRADVLHFPARKGRQARARHRRPLLRLHAVRTRADPCGEGAYHYRNEGLHQARGRSDFGRGRRGANVVCYGGTDHGRGVVACRLEEVEGQIWVRSSPRRAATWWRPAR